MNKRAIAGGFAAALCFVAQAAHAILPIEHWQTPGGARVYFVENHDLPMFDLSVEFPAGSAYDTKEKSGAASMTSRMLKRGAGDMSEEDIAIRIGNLGAELGARFGTDSAGLALRSLSSADQRRQAVEIFARVLGAPQFPAPILEREKQRVISALSEADTKPETIASRNFYRLVYGDHPYALRLSGEPDTVAKLTREDLVRFYRAHYVANHAVVALIGDLTRDEAEAIAEKVTAGLARSDGPELRLPPVPALKAPATRKIAHPASQAHILIGEPGIARSDPDYFALYVGNYVLGGGGFVSRINEEVRQERGLAYSAYSYFAPLERKGPFVIGMQTARGQTELALGVVRKTLRKFLKAGPTEKELIAAKQNIIGGFPLRIDSNAKILEYLALIGFYRLPITYLEDFAGNVERVTAEGVREAFARHINPDRLVTVVVGGEPAAAAPAR